MNNLLTILDVLDKKLFTKYAKQYSISDSISDSSLNNNMYIYTLNEYKECLISHLKKQIQIQIQTQTQIQTQIKTQTQTQVQNILVYDDISIINVVEIFLHSKITKYYLPNIRINIKYFDSIKHIEQKSQEWLDTRINLIPASESGYLLGVKGVGVMMNYICNKVGVSTMQDVLKNMLSIQHGNIFEDVSRMIYETRNNVIVKEYGLIKSRNNNILSASPDGIVIQSCNSNSDYRIGRLLEIKNPFSYDASDDIKPEYMIQMQQQLYVLESPICDFIKTNIVGLNANNTTIKNGFTPYTTLDSMLNDKYINDKYINEDTTITEQQDKDKIQDKIQYKIHNTNIPIMNLNSKGMEKGLLISYKDTISGNIKVIIYSIVIEYNKDTIVKWISTTKDDLIKNGIILNTIYVQYWYIAKYFEKTILYNKKLFEDNYMVRLNLIWDLINYIKKNKNLNKNLYTSHDDTTSKQITNQLQNQLRNQFINTKLRAHFNKPSLYYKNIDNFNNICAILKQSLQLIPDKDIIIENETLQSSGDTVSQITNKIKNIRIIELDF